MSVDAKTLYQKQVLDHAKSPRNEGKLDAHTHQARGVNPLCGDRVTVYLRMDGDRVAEVRFKAQGCAIAKASASMMTTVVQGRSRDEARALSDRLKASLGSEAAPLAPEDPLLPFTGVRHFPTRARCATLAWETLDEALDE